LIDSFTQCDSNLHYFFSVKRELFACLKQPTSSRPS